MSNIHNHPENMEDKMKQIINEALSLWNDKFKLPMRLSDAASAQIAELTDGFSFAYLKELFLSSKVQWMETKAPGSMEKVMISLSYCTKRANERLS